jgi:site-specific DNA recombinase
MPGPGPVSAGRLLYCGTCGRRMESAWSNGKPAYRCRHGYTSASLPDPDRPKNSYVREEKVLAQLPALDLMLAAALHGGSSPVGHRSAPHPRRRRREQASSSRGHHRPDPRA